MENKHLLNEELLRICELMNISPKHLLFEGRLDLLDIKRLVGDAVNSAKFERRTLATTADELAELADIERISNDLNTKLAEGEDAFITKLDELSNSTKQVEKDFAKLVDTKVANKLETDYAQEFTDIGTDVTKAVDEIKTKNPNIPDNDLTDATHIYIEDGFEKTVKLADGTEGKLADIESPYLREKAIKAAKKKAGLDPNYKPVRKTTSTLTKIQRIRNTVESWFKSVETKKTELLTRLDSATTEEEFKKILDEYMDFMSSSYKQLGLPKESWIKWFNGDYNAWKTKVERDFKKIYSQNIKNVEDSTWWKYVQKLTDAQKDEVIKDAVSKALKKVEKKVDSKTFEKLKKWASRLSGKTLMDKAGLSVWHQSLVRLGVYVFINAETAYVAKKLKEDYDIDLPDWLPPYTVDFESWGYGSNVIGNIGAIISNILLTIPNLIVAFIEYGVYLLYNKDEDDTYRVKLENYITQLEQQKYNFNLNTAQNDKLHTFVTNMYKGVPGYESLLEVLDTVHSGATGSELRVKTNKLKDLPALWQIWANQVPDNVKLTEDDYREIFYGLPIAIPGFAGNNQIIPINDDFYYVTPGNLFKIEDFEGEDPYINGVEDGDDVVIKLRDIFLKDKNKFLPGITAKDEPPVIDLQVAEYNLKVNENDGWPSKDMEILLNSTGILSNKYLPQSEVNKLKEHVKKYGKEINLGKIAHYRFYNDGDLKKTHSNEFTPIEGKFPVKKENGDNLEAFYYIDKDGTPLRILNLEKDITGISSLAQNSLNNTTMLKDVWYARKDGKWYPLIDLLDNSPENNTAPSASAAKSPKEKWEEEHPGVKLTQTGAIGKLVTYSGSDGKRYKQENGQIVEF